MGAFGHQRSWGRGFTVFEIIGVLAVIAIIMTILVMALGGVKPAAEAKAARTEIILIQQSLEAYKRKFGEYPKRVQVNGSYPPMEEILFNALGGSLTPNGKLGSFPSLLDRSNLTFANTNFPSLGGTPAFISNHIVDPWGEPYHYRYDPDEANWENYAYVLFSAGPNGTYTDVTSEGRIDLSGVGNQDNVYAE